LDKIVDKFKENFNTNEDDLPIYANIHNFENGQCDNNNGGRISSNERDRIFTKYLEFILSIIGGVVIFSSCSKR